MWEIFFKLLWPSQNILTLPNTPYTLHNLVKKGPLSVKKTIENYFVPSAHKNVVKRTISIESLFRKN